MGYDTITPVVGVIVSFVRRKGTIPYYFICGIDLSVITKLLDLHYCIIFE